MKKVVAVLGFVCVLLSGCLSTQASTKNQDVLSKRYKVNNPIDAYVAPFFASNPLSFQVGKYSQDLVAANQSSILELEAKIESDIQNTNVETFYALSIQMYNLGYKDKATYWLYSAQHYARIYRYSVDPQKRGSIGSPAFEYGQATIAFNRTVGTWINGFAFGDISSLIRILNLVYEVTKRPYDPKTIYKNVEFKDDAEIAANNQKSRQETLEMIKYIEENKSALVQQRKGSQVDGKF